MPDYDLDDALVVAEPEQLRALGDPVRSRILTLLLERAASTTELADAVSLAKGTVRHHLNVLEQAGLVRVVRTRRVRALTERFYGRVARLFVVRSGEDVHDASETRVVAAALRQAADEVALADNRGAAFEAASAHVRLTDEDARRFARRVERLARDIRAAAANDGGSYGFVVGFYPMGRGK